MPSERFPSLFYNAGCNKAVQLPFKGRDALPEENNVNFCALIIHSHLIFTPISALTGYSTTLPAYESNHQIRGA